MEFLVQAVVVDQDIVVEKARVLTSTLGGGLGNSRFVISSQFGGFYIDDFGRILILSTTDNTIPNDLPQTTGIVNIGDKACIDDADGKTSLILQEMEHKTTD